MLQSLSVRKYVSLSAFWFSLSFQQAALLTIVIPATVDRLTSEGHIVLLAQLTTVGDIIAMLTMPAIGAISDRIRMRGGRRRTMIVAGAIANAAGLVVGGSANHVLLFAAGFLVAMLGLSTAGAAFQAIMPEVVTAKEWGKASGYMGVAMLLGNAIGLAVTGFMAVWVAYVVMIAVTTGGAIYTFFGVEEPAESPLLLKGVRPQPRPAAFYWVFTARFLVMFGQTLLMTFVLYYFQDVLHVSRPSVSTAELSLMALVGAALASLALGAVSDRLNRAKIVAIATLPMAAATVAFGLTTSADWMLGFAVLYGAGYGAFLSVDWALALDTMPSLENVARSLGIWGIAATLPSVIAPAAGGAILHRPGSLAANYEALYWLAGLVILAGAVVVWFASDPPVASVLSVPASLVVTAILGIAVTMKARARMIGRLPRRGSVLVISNHANDLDGAFVPPRLFLRSRWWQAPVYSVASQRLFEPGFLARRGPRWLAPILRGFNAGPILRHIGIRPIEEALRTRPLASWAADIGRVHGRLALAAIVQPQSLQVPLPPRPDGREWQISDLYRPRLLECAKQRVSLRAIAEPYRSELRTQLSARVLQQVREIQDLLEHGRTVFVTPEGRLTPNGLIGSFHGVIDPLLHKARHMILSAIAYDPLHSGRMGVICRLVPYTPRLAAEGEGSAAGDTVSDVRRAIAAARPLTASHLCARACAVIDGAPLSQERVVTVALDLLQSVPNTAFLTENVRRHPERAVRQVFSHLVAAGYVVAQSGGEVARRARQSRRGTVVDEPLYRLAEPWVDRRFPFVNNLFRYLDNQWNETTAALAAEPGTLTSKLTLT